ncbi:hypothetical protein BT67DRAFT_414835, partial [Trichocladium antarcticum]
MGRLGPLTSQALGRSPYDDVVQGEGPEDSRDSQQMYDERGRPINPETKRINRDVIRSHNEVMMVIGVAEPENGIAEAQAEAALKHREYEDRIGRRLLLAGGVLETAAIWGVNGMRQRILLYKEYSQATFHGMFGLVWRQQSISSYFFGGLPSFLASTILEQLAVPGSKKYPAVQYATTYIRLHLAIYTFFQRTGIIPPSNLLPNWRFFIPGTSMSPISIPPVPTSLCPVGISRWLGGIALGVAPFAGFYLYTKMYSLITRTLRFKIYRLLPRPYNANKRRSARETTPVQLGTDIPVEVRTEEIIEPTAPTDSAWNPGSTPLRRQSTLSLRGSGTDHATTAATTTTTATAVGPDDFASDDEDAELISATLISFDVEATESMPDFPTHFDDNNNNNNNTTTTTTTPGLWSAELRPNIPASETDHNHPAHSGTHSGCNGGGGSANSAHEPVYRESVLTRLPAVLAT